MNAEYIDEQVSWSPEAESGVIGALLTVGAEAFDAVADLLTASDFLGTVNALAFAQIAKTVNAGQQVDLIGVYEALRTADAATDILPQLNAASQSFVGMRVLRQHATIVAEHAKARALQKAAAEVRLLAFDESVPVSDRISQSKAVFEAVGATKQEFNAKVAGDHVAGFIDRLNEIADGKTIPGIPTGIPTLDSLLGGGLKPGKQIIVAARPSVGKSSLTQQIALNVAKNGVPAAIFSMEMECSELTDRTVANMGRVRLSAIADGKLDDEEWGRVIDGVESIRNLPLYFYDKPALSLSDIASQARQLSRKHGLRVLIVDYLQLASARDIKASRHHQIEEISRGLKTLAKQLGLTIILLSQLNRDVEKRVTGRPILADLKESGAIEEDADTVMLLWRHKELDGHNIIGCAIPKNRQGRIGEVALHFEGQYQRWTESTESLIEQQKPIGKSNRYADDF